MKFIKKLYQKNRFFDILVYFLICLYTLAAILVSLHRYWQYDAFHYDLGIFNAAIWHASRFRAPIIDHEASGGKWIFADHFVPSIFLFSPLYWLTNRVEVLLVAQSLCVTAGLIFAHLIAGEKIKNKFFHLALLIAFMGFVGLQYGIISNFHPVVAAIFPLMVCFWAVLNRKWKIYWPAFLIFLAFQEDLALIGLGLGIYLCLKREKQLRQGLWTIFISVFYGVIVSWLIIPFFSGGQYHYWPSFKKPILNWLIDFFWPPMKLKTLLISFATFGFLPLFYGPFLPTLLIVFYSRFVLNTGPARWDLALHYSALVSPLMFLASVEKVRILEKRKKIKSWLNFYAFLIIFLVFFFHRVVIHGPLGLAYHPEFYKNTPRQKFLNDFVARVPPEGSVMTQNHLSVHLMNRQERVYLFKDKYWLYQPDYIVFELREGQNPNNFWPSHRWVIEEAVEKLKKDERYQLIYHQNDQYLFEKK
jgi:uncharacterized membrane protein